MIVRLGRRSLMSRAASKPFIMGIFKSRSTKSIGVPLWQMFTASSPVLAGRIMQFSFIFTLSNTSRKWRLRVSSSAISIMYGFSELWFSAIDGNTLGIISSSGHGLYGSETKNVTPVPFS